MPGHPDKEIGKDNMYDEYFEEINAKKRADILSKMQVEPGGEEALEQIRALHSLRYEVNKKGKSIDLFLRVLVSLRAQVGARVGKLSESKYEKRVQDDLHTLCLDRTDEFSRDILYRELCNLISLYIYLCYDDPHYRSVALGFGKMSDEKLERKIRTDITELWNEIPKYVDVTDDDLILKRAMDDMLDQKLIENQSIIEF